LYGSSISQLKQIFQLKELGGGGGGRNQFLVAKNKYPVIFIVVFRKTSGRCYIIEGVNFHGLLDGKAPFCVFLISSKYSAELKIV
jgi:hypothetical protein